MTLKEFILSYVCRNTLVRLWVEIEDGHRLLEHPSGKQLFMEWELLKDNFGFDYYNDWLVIGVTDIVCDTYSEAVNIVIQKPVLGGE